MDFMIKIQSQDINPDLDKILIWLFLVFFFGSWKITNLVGQIIYKIDSLSPSWKNYYLVTSNLIKISRDSCLEIFFFWEKNNRNTRNNKREKEAQG